MPEAMSPGTDQSQPIPMRLVISAASRVSDVRILSRIYERVGERLPHVASLLVTPLCVTPETVRLARQFGERFDVPVMFDSGGYAVQTGKLDYFEMYSRLIAYYDDERWAGLYTLPDNVPKSSDSEPEVWAKVRQTVDCSAMFYRELPDELRPRALAVVHGHSRAQLEYCLDAYLNLGLRHIGFGSFGTTGQNSGVNVATVQAVANARGVAGLARAAGASVHLFGIGSPALLPWLAGTGATSFDSANWARSAGFGQVFLPLTRGYNVSHRSTTSEIQQGLSRAEFERLRAVSGHACPYCAEFDTLQASREARAAHNLLATIDSLDLIARNDVEAMDKIYQAASPKYRTLWRQWVTTA